MGVKLTIRRIVLETRSTWGEQAHSQPGRRSSRSSDGLALRPLRNEGFVLLETMWMIAGRISFPPGSLPIMKADVGFPETALFPSRSTPLRKSGPEWDTPPFT